MVTTSKSILNQQQQITQARKPLSLWNQYLAYADRQDQNKIFWYMKVIIAIPCVFMVSSIIAMGYLTPNYIWFVGLSMLLFFANVLLHISEAKGRFFVPLYHVTVGVSILIPFITYLINP